MVVKNDLLKDEIKIDFNNRASISPFYQEENRDYYKNKLIKTEDIVYQEKLNIDSDFESCKVSFCYILTFEDEKGNIHHYESKSKPKKIGEIFYYIVEDNKIIKIFSEENKKELKKHILISNKSLPYKNKIFKCNQFIIDNLLKIYPVTFIISSILVYLTGYFSDLQNIKQPEQAKYVLPILTGFLITSLSSFIMIGISGIEDKILNKIRNEQREKMLKEFI